MLIYPKANLPNKPKNLKNKKDNSQNVPRTSFKILQFNDLMRRFKSLNYCMMKKEERHGLVNEKRNEAFTKLMHNLNELSSNISTIQYEINKSKIQQFTGKRIINTELAKKVEKLINDIKLEIPNQNSKYYKQIRDILNSLENYLKDNTNYFKAIKSEVDSPLKHLESTYKHYKNKLKELFTRKKEYWELQNVSQEEHNRNLTIIQYYTRYVKMYRSLPNSNKYRNALNDLIRNYKKIAIDYGLEYTNQLAINNGLPKGLKLIGLN